MHYYTLNIKKVGDSRSSITCNVGTNWQSVTCKHCLLSCELQSYSTT